ncbi:MAG: dihydrolipoamide acetyltransferase [Deltaproteobacteria bacterium]|nr:dihydrolipoamide acetyltransferase [Deltaproteobacteria bacterium]
MRPAIFTGIVLILAFATGVDAKPDPNAKKDKNPAAAPPAKPPAEEMPAAVPLEALPAGLAEQDTARLEGLEERVADLKEKLFRTRAKLLLLKESVLSGEISGSKARIVHNNEMGSGFRLERALYVLDGAPIFDKTASEGQEIVIDPTAALYDAPVAPGNHLLSVQLLFRGTGYGVFSYLEGYEFDIKSSYAFTAEEGKATTVHVVPFEKGGLTTELTDRPAIRYDVEVRSAAAPTE